MPAGESISLGYASTYYNGTYAKPMPVGAYSVWASASCHTYSGDSTITLPPSLTGLDFTIRLRDQLIAGRTIDSDSQPVCGASVRANGSYSDSDSSARNGRYALQVPSGAYKVGATKSGYHAPPEQNVTVPPYATASTSCSRRRTGAPFRARCAIATAPVWRACPSLPRDPTAAPRQ